MIISISYPDIKKNMPHNSNIYVSNLENHLFNNMSVFDTVADRL